jgi:ATP-dependent Clp protease ATP-binding subunit ClpA
MWQRFTERARRAIFFAQEEAIRRKHNEVSTEYLALGLLRETDSGACRILAKTECPPARLRAEIEQHLTEGKAKSNSDIHLSGTAKRVIDLGYDTARNRNDDHIGTEHLLFGLWREERNIVAKSLRDRGITLDSLQQLIQQIRDASAPRQIARRIVPLLKQLPEEHWKQLTEEGLPFIVLPEEIRGLLTDMVFKGLKPTGLLFSFEDSLVRVVEVPEADGSTRFEVTVTGQTTINVSSLEIAGEG